MNSKIDHQLQLIIKPLIRKVTKNVFSSEKELS